MVGWVKQGSGVPLAAGQRAGFAAAPLPAPSCPARHCWVADAADGSAVKRPGLLVEWRHSDVGWLGRVIYAASLRPGEWLVVEEWMPAALLTAM